MELTQLVTGTIVVAALVGALVVVVRWSASRRT
jgi:hypothetical protein